MDKQQWRNSIGRKIRMIRLGHLNKVGQPMRQGEFCVFLKTINPTDVIIDRISLGKYERGEVNIPGDKLEKIYSLDKKV